MATKHKGSKKEVLALDTYIKLIRATETIRSEFTSSILNYGITEIQFYCLDAVFHLGPLTQKDLGYKLSRSGGNITLVVDNLEKAGLVKRQKDKEDRRKYYVVITKKGARLYKKNLQISIKATH